MELNHQRLGADDMKNTLIISRPRLVCYTTKQERTCFFMWLEEKKTNSGTVYKYVERYTCPFSGKTKKVSITFKKKGKQAEKAAYTALQEKILKITHPDVLNDKTLESLLDEFIAYRKPFVKPTTNNGHEQSKSIIVRLFPKDILISKLSTAIIQTTLSAFLEKHKYSYVKTLFSLISQSLKYARRMNYLTDISFLDNVCLPRPLKTADDVKKEREKFLSKDDLIDFLAKLTKINSNVALICEFQSLTGLRIGELLALRIKDYNKKENYIDINGTLTSRYTAKDGNIRLSPKNSYSIRKVWLDARANQILHIFILANNARRLLKPGFNPGNYIFVTDGGLPYDVHFINRIIKRVKFYKPVSTHTFRHTHISLLAESNVPLKAIMERVGHNESKTTLSVYTHVTNEMQKEVCNAIDLIGKRIAAK